MKKFVISRLCLWPCQGQQVRQGDHGHCWKCVPSSRAFSEPSLPPHQGHEGRQGHHRHERVEQAQDHQNPPLRQVCESRRGGICICLFSYSTKIRKQIIAKIQKNEDELRLNLLQRWVLQKHFESPDHFHDLPLRSQWYLFTATLLTEVSKLIKT